MVGLSGTQSNCENQTKSFMVSTPHAKPAIFFISEYFRQERKKKHCSRLSWLKDLKPVSKDINFRDNQLRGGVNQKISHSGLAPYVFRKCHETYRQQHQQQD